MDDHIERHVKYRRVKKNVYRILLGVPKKREDCFRDLGVDKRMILKLS